MSYIVLKRKFQPGTRVRMEDKHGTVLCVSHDGKVFVSWDDEGGLTGVPYGAVLPV